MKTFLYKNHSIKFYETGKGRPLLFLHNGGNDHRIWEYQIRHFQKSHRIFAMDQLGYGESDRPPVEYSLDLYTDILGSFIETLKIKKPVLIGNCLGSAMSLRYALQKPQNVRGMVLCNVLTRDTLEKGFFGPVCKAVNDHHGICSLVDRIKDYRITRWFAIKYCPFFLYGPTGEPDNEFIAHLKRLYGHNEQMPMLYSLIKNCRSFQYLDDMRKPDNFPPAHVIWGEKNRVLPSRAGNGFCERLNLEQLEIVSNCGHLVMREAHDTVNESIERFLSTLA